MNEVSFYIDTDCDEIASFDSGYSVFNEYLFQRSDTASFHYILDGETDELIAYFSLLASALLHGDPANLNAIPAIELKMFALDKRHHGSDLSSKLLDAIITTMRHYSTKYVGADTIVLYSVPAEGVIKLYKSKGFIEVGGELTAFKDEFTKGCIPMYLVL